MRGREDVKGRRRSVLMTPAVPERIRVLSPSWYRAAVEFQGKPESEQLDFCSWCCCHGGCNLCADISKYMLRKEFESLRRELPTLWTRSFYVESVGHISEQTIIKYIENQKNI